MFTSNFKKHGRHPNAVAISLSVPTSYKGKRVHGLSPSWDMISELKLSGDAGAFEDRYQKEVLSKLNPKVFYDALMENYPQPCILLCYEDGDEFCHRHIVSEWFERELGITVTELNRKDDRV